MSKGNAASVDVVVLADVVVMADLVVLAKWVGCDTTYFTDAIPKTLESFLFTELEHPEVLIFTK